MNPLNFLVRFILILFGIIYLSGCATPTPSLTPTPIPPTPVPTQPSLRISPGLIAGTVDVGGYSLYIMCMGEGSPTVVFEAGLGMGGWTGWSGALAEVSKHTLACAYSRAGEGGSDPPISVPRTSQDIVDDLHTLLTNAPIPGPYILVGHSIGGLNVRLYSSQYSQDVVGLIFIDSSHPDQDARMCTALPAESTGEPADFIIARAACEATPVPVTDWWQVAEGWDLVTSAAQVRNTGPFGDLPLVVLTAEFSIMGQADTIAGVHGECWNQLQQELAALSTQGQQILVYADHLGILSKPATYDAIIEMVESLQSK
jgi:pimeloyl-ACP methyl ester carboxylesterase